MKILTIEDDRVSRMLLEGMLRQHGHEVFTATDGIDVLAQIIEHGVRVVVSDWMMPGMDGLELCRRVRQLNGDYIYFILITQRTATRQNREAAMLAGVDEFLVKPVNNDELWMRLHVAERILGLTQQVRHLEGILPICSHCKKVRDDKKAWHEVESYVSSHTGAKFSHGICPDCMESIMLPQLKELGLDSLPARKSES